MRGSHFGRLQRRRPFPKGRSEGGGLRRAGIEPRSPALQANTLQQWVEQCVTAARLPALNAASKYLHSIMHPGVATRSLLIGGNHAKKQTFSCQPQSDRPRLHQHPRVAVVLPQIRATECTRQKPGIGRQQSPRALPRHPLLTAGCQHNQSDPPAQSPGGQIKHYYL